MTVARDVRRFGAEDLSALVALRREALEADPTAFGASLDDDRGLDPDFVRSVLTNADEEAIFGYFDGEDWAGMVGIARVSKTKERHTAIIWGMYVSSRIRNKGVGRALLDAAIRQAGAWGLDHVQLSVTETSASARRLYESAGFRLWGRQPRALLHGGRFLDTDHLTLDLRGRPFADSR
jgi:ribosomal protein S18 acetylase RimI-like enzyme